MKYYEEMRYTIKTLLEAVLASFREISQSQLIILDIIKFGKETVFFK